MSRPKNRIDNKTYPIRPEHFNTDTKFYAWSVSSSANALARLIIQICKAKGGWVPLDWKKLVGLFLSQGLTRQQIRFGMKDLLDWGYLVREDLDKGVEHYHVTHQFVCRCLEDHTSSQFPGLLPERIN